VGLLLRVRRISLRAEAGFYAVSLGRVKLCSFKSLFFCPAARADARAYVGLWRREHQVPRLRRWIRFANPVAALGMTDFFVDATYVAAFPAIRTRGSLRYPAELLLCPDGRGRPSPRGHCCCRHADRNVRAHGLLWIRVLGFGFGYTLCDIIFI
jgi:hypothetical protein